MFGGYTVWMSVADMANFYSDQQQGDQVAVLELVWMEAVSSCFSILQARQSEQP